MGPIDGPFPGPELGAKPRWRSTGHEARVRGYHSNKAFLSIRISLVTDEYQWLNDICSIYPDGFNQA